MILTLESGTVEASTKAEDRAWVTKYHSNFVRPFTLGFEDLLVKITQQQAFDIYSGLKEFFEEVEDVHARDQ